ncbi:MAG: class I SAM-dependent methyltransferase [Bacillota bacterium]
MSRMTGYSRPQGLAENSGGFRTSPGGVDARLRQVLDVLRCHPLADAQDVLDVGIGAGQISKWLAEQGKRVTGTGLAMESYESDLEQLKTKYGIQIVECPADDMPFEDGSFDAVVMSHVLEHCPNVGAALAEAWRVLRDGGYLHVFVPASSIRVVPGHVSVGWVVGQLMYVLLVAGFDVRAGKFIRHGYSVCACVRKNAAMELPCLRGDTGDLLLLWDAGLLPVSVAKGFGRCDGFHGDLEHINWTSQELSRLQTPGSAKFRMLQRLAILMLSLLPLQCRELLTRFTLESMAATWTKRLQNSKAGD